MQVLITGATGLIGTRLTQRLLSKSCSITILTRDIDRAKHRFGNNINYCPSLSQFQTLNGFDAVINLAGEPIADRRWTDTQKQRLCQSRWSITERLAQLIKLSDAPPSVFISGSAVGYYGSQGNESVTEQTAPHPEFTHSLCQRWEELAESASGEQTRVCILRTGIVLAKEGGALAKMLPPFRFGLGGALGSGTQYMPWIHIDDMINAIDFLLFTPGLSGPFNMCAPNPVTNATFSHTLAATLKRPCLMPIPACGLKLLFGEASTLLLNGQRAYPCALQRAQFRFSYETLAPALANLLSAAR